jgi:hypothetical protein
MEVPAAQDASGQAKLGFTDATDVIPWYLTFKSIYIFILM